MNMKSNVIVAVDEKVVRNHEVGIVLCIQRMAAVKRYVRVLCQHVGRLMVATKCKDILKIIMWCFSDKLFQSNKTTTTLFQPRCV